MDDETISAMRMRVFASIALRIEAGIDRAHEAQLAAWRRSPIRAVDPPASPVFTIDSAS